MKISTSRLVALLLFTTLIPLVAQDTLRMEVDTVASGFSGPIALRSAEGMLWVAEKEGSIYRVDPQSGERVRLKGGPDDIFQPKRMGLYGMVLHPDFSENSTIYLYYSYIRTYEDGSWSHLAKVVRYRYEADSLVDPTTILDSITSVAWHPGGGMVVLPDETLLVGTGDGIDYLEEPLSFETTRGKVLRVGLDGRIPEDNPWSDLPYPLNSIYAIGFRNVTALEWAGERLLGLDWGTTLLDELNVIEAGGNFGWSRVLGNCDGYPFLDELDYCDTVEVENPLYEWYKVEGRSATPWGVLLYDGGAIAHWQGRILVTAQEGVHALTYGPDGEEIFRRDLYTPSVASGLAGRSLRGMTMTDEGELYVATWTDPAEEEGEGGRDLIVRITAADIPPAIDEGTPLRVRTVIEDLAVPWEITWGTDNMIWMTEREGRVSRLDPESGDRSVILTLEPATITNTGLLGLALHPNFCDSSYLYLVYNYLGGPKNDQLLERLSRFWYEESRDTLLDETVLLEGIRVSPDHAGSRLVIARDRTIFMTTGDADRTDSTQTTASLVGSVLRMNLDGSPPADNPFIDQPWPAPLVWTYGHRNPQGLHLASNGILYSSEHGPAIDDEVNIIVPGGNYGWAEVLGYCDTPYEKRICEEKGIIEPLIAWSPTIAPAGLSYYDHDAIPEWKGSLLLTILKNRRLLQIKLNEPGDSVIATNPYFAYDYGRIRDICVAPDGRVFLAVSNRDVQGVPREGDDAILEISAVSGHPELPAPGELCDTIPKVEGAVPTSGTLQIGNVFPLPVVEGTRLSFGRTVGPGVIDLYDQEGRRVVSRDMEGGSSVWFDRGDLPNGVYVAEVRASRYLYRFRLLFR